MGSMGPQKSGRVSVSRRVGLRPPKGYGPQAGEEVTSSACQQVARSRPSADGLLRGPKHHKRPQVNQHTGRNAAE